MNLIEIQDDLKNLSDQQLAQAMRGSAAPSYMVLAELQRRKDMRAKADGASQGPQRSMAEEAVAGIASLPPPQGMAPVAAKAMGAPMQMGAPPPPAQMAGGGIVRMQAGGQIPVWRGFELPSITNRPVGSTFGLGGTNMTNAPVGSTITPPPNPFGASGFDALAQARMDYESGIRARPDLARDPQYLEQVASSYGVSPDELRVAVQLAPPVGPAGRAAESIEPPSPRNNPVDAEAAQQGLQPAGQSDIPLPPTSPSAPPPAGRAPGGGGIASVGVANPAAATPNTPAASADATEDYITQLRKEMGNYRSESAKERQDAQNMALIEAGLRIAGSQSPHFAAGIAEAAPALQSYAKAKGDIRRDERENRQLQIALEREATMDKYRAAQERRLDAQNELERERLGIMRSQIGASAGRDPITKVKELTDYIAGIKDPEQRRIAEGLAGVRNSQEKTFDPRLTSLYGEGVKELKELEAALTMAPPARQKEISAQIAALRQRQQNLYNTITGGGSVIPFSELAR